VKAVHDTQGKWFSQTIMQCNFHLSWTTSSLKKGIDMSKKVVLLAILAYFGLYAQSVTAKAYRWLDDEGNVVYSQTLPQDGRNATRVDTPPPPAAASQSSQDSVKKLNEKLDAIAKDREKKKQQQTKLEQGRKQRQKNYNMAKQNLQVITERPPNTLFRLPNGEYRRFTVEERQQKIDVLNKIIEKNCN